MDRYKARLVARGFTQTFGMDYLEIFSHVASLNSICVIFSLAVNRQWLIFQLDMKNTFLYDDLEKEVYIEQPPSYVAKEENMVCKLKKVIYDLKSTCLVL